MSRILQAANFVAPHSGGIRTVLEHLACGYAAAGHEVVQIVPGRPAGTVRTGWGERITLEGIPLPGTGYRALSFGSVTELAAQLAADRIEVHDRTTLRGLGAWARRRDIPALVVSHERLDRLLGQWLPGRALIEHLADRNNAALASGFHCVVCTTQWAAEEFTRLGPVKVVRVPLGVDLNKFQPSADPRLRERLAPDGAAMLVMASRLSREKHPELALRVTAELLARGRRVRLVVAGDGPQRRRLERKARGLPITFLGHVPSVEMPALLSTADVVLAPGPVETFGLAALEALASGTPVVGNAASALREVLGTTGGIVADGSPGLFADAVQELLDRPRAQRLVAARRRAEGFDWSATVAGFLAAHELTHERARVA
jgi:alpha-1,6-mannosyltransferase